MNKLKNQKREKESISVSHKAKYLAKTLHLDYIHKLILKNIKLNKKGKARLFFFISSTG